MDELLYRRLAEAFDLEADALNLDVPEAMCRTCGVRIPGKRRDPQVIHYCSYACYCEG